MRVNCAIKSTRHYWNRNCGTIDSDRWLYYWIFKHLDSDMRRVLTKPDFCIGENKDADQLRSNCEADQRLCFRYFFCDCSGRFVSDLVRNPKGRFSCVMAHIINYMYDDTENGRPQEMSVSTMHAQCFILYHYLFRIKMKYRRLTVIYSVYNGP